MTTVASDRNLAQRLHAAMASIGEIEKTGQMEGHGNYRFVEGSVVAKKVREACLANGIVILVSSRDARTVGETTSRSGTKQTITRVDLDLLFINIDDPTDTYLTTSTGDGQDDMDKGVPKAITGALKGGLRNAFLIADANDPERDQRGSEPVQQGLPPGYPGGDEFAAFLAAQAASQQATSAALPHPEDVVEAVQEAVVGAVSGLTVTNNVLAEPPKRTRAPRTPKEPAPVAEQVAAAVEQPVALASDGKKALARARQHVVGLSDEQFKAMSGFLTKKASSTEWTDADADDVIAGLANEGLTAIFKQGVFDTAATA